MVGTDREAIHAILGEMFGALEIVSVARAALGLSAVLRSWARATGNRSVAMPAAVCHDVLVAVLDAGCIPTFCDIDPASGLVTRDEWLRARAAGASVAIVVHLYGNLADVGEVHAIFAGHDCLVIDDAAQALGGQTSGSFVGGLGNVGLLSFGLTKQISAGGAALLFRDAAFAREVEKTLAAIDPAPDADRAALQGVFRARLAESRALLRQQGSIAARSFVGLVDDMGPTLRIPFPVSAERKVRRELMDYSARVERRRAKRDIWMSRIEGSPLKPVGMGADTVPWRFTCRIPGFDWRMQHELGEAIRGHGIHVSHWYLPAHWLVGSGAGPLPGAEKLSQEVFQFWVDEETSTEQIRDDSALAVQTVTQYPSTGSENAPSQ